MKIEIKNIKLNLSFSEETICFMADVYVDGKKVFYARNEGHGGSTDVSPYPNNSKKLEEVNNFLRTEDDIYCSPIERYVDDIIYAYADKKEREKADKRLAKEMLKGLIISKNNLQSYSIIHWKMPLADVFNCKGGAELVKETIAKYTAEGYVVFNTNIPKEVLCS